MASTNTYGQAVAAELDKVGVELACGRYPHETNDEDGYRLVAVIEDAIDDHEVEIALLNRFWATVKTLL